MEKIMRKKSLWLQLAETFGVMSRVETKVTATNQ